MGDMADVFREMNADKKEAKARRRISGPDALTTILNCGKSKRDPIAGAREEKAR